MSIFGFKKYTADKNNLSLRVNDLYKRFQNVYTKIENPKLIITISAESKGSLIKGKVFSFGNGGKEKGVGYVVMRSGHITGISLSSERSSGEVRVGVLVNGVDLNWCEITLNTTPRKHDNFDKPFFVDFGSVINFVSLGFNGTTVNTVASLLIEFTAP